VYVRWAIRTLVCHAGGDNTDMTNDERKQSNGEERDGVDRLIRNRDASKTREAEEG
jgi:hypothetical protein